jgi:phosphomevalonate kinase
MDIKERLAKKKQLKDLKENIKARRKDLNKITV